MILLPELTKANNSTSNSDCTNNEKNLFENKHQYE